MTLGDIISTFLEPVGIIGVIILIGSFIKIKPLEINVWSWVLRQIGNATNAELKSDMKALHKDVVNIEEKLEAHIIADEADSARRIRSRILRFNDEIIEGQHHTQEHFDDVLEAIDMYEKYCQQHPEFPNNKALLAIKNIKRKYDECLQLGNFD